MICKHLVERKKEALCVCRTTPNSTHVVTKIVEMLIVEANIRLLSISYVLSCSINPTVTLTCNDPMNMTNIQQATLLHHHDCHLYSSNPPFS